MIEAIDRKQIASIVEAYARGEATGSNRHRLADDLIRLVIENPHLLPEVPDAVLGRADKDSSLAPGFGDEPSGYRVKVNRWDLERSGRDPALAEQWEEEDRLKRGFQPSMDVIATMERTEELRQNFFDADEAFKRELVRAYGTKDAGTARYKRTHSDPKVQAAADAFGAAAEAWDAQLNRTRHYPKGKP